MHFQLCERVPPTKMTRQPPLLAKTGTAASSLPLDGLLGTLAPEPQSSNPSPQHPTVLGRGGRKRGRWGGRGEPGSAVLGLTPDCLSFPY